MVTAHSAFAYFCRDFDFKAIPVLGLTTQDQPTPGYIQQVIQSIREKKVEVIFPQIGSNPKILDSIVNETGVKVGDALLADTPHSENPTYIAMIKHNVLAISNAYASP